VSPDQRRRLAAIEQRVSVKASKRDTLDFERLNDHQLYVLLGVADRLRAGEELAAILEARPDLLESFEEIAAVLQAPRPG
jgi:hypothetical protein